MKKNTKKFISSVVALGMAFSSVSATSVVFADDAAAVEADSTASGSAVEVEDLSVITVDGDVETKGDSVLMTEPKLTTDANVAYGDTQTIGDVTVKFMQDCNTGDIADADYAKALTSVGTNNASVDGGSARCIAVLTTANDCSTKIVVKAFGDTKVAAITESDTELAVLNDATTPVAMDKTYTIDYVEGATTFSKTIDMKAGKFYYISGKATNLGLVDIIPAESAAGGEEEVKTAGNATVNPEVEKYTVTTADRETTVKLVLSADDEKGAFSSVTGLFKWNPEFATLTKATAVATNADNQVFDEKDFSTNLNVTISDSLEGYDAADVGKTEAEVGKLKLGRYFKTNSDLVDLTRVEYSLTFTVKADTGSDIVTFEPMMVKNSEDAKVTVASNPATIEIGEAAKTGTYAIAVDGVEPNAEGKIVLTNDKDTFKVVVSAANDFDVNAITATLTYDPTVVQAVSAEAAANTALLPADVVNTAIKYVPSAANTEFAGADGTKTAAELGKIKLANVVTDSSNTLKDEALTKDQTLLVITFKAVGKGDSAIKFSNIQSTNVAMDEVVTTGSEAEVDVTSEISNNTYHLLGDMDHDGVLMAGDASQALYIVNHDAYPLDIAIGDVLGNDGVLDAGDASKILSGVNRNLTYEFTDRTDAVELTDANNFTQKYVPVTIPEGTDTSSWKALITK